MSGLLCLDAGQRVGWFLDHAPQFRAALKDTRLRRLRRRPRRGAPRKSRSRRAAVLAPPWSRAHVAASRGWAGFGRDNPARRRPCGRAPCPTCSTRSGPSACSLNLLVAGPRRLVPGALDRARAAGVRIVPARLQGPPRRAARARLGVRGSLNLVVDGGLVGGEKPDPRIFEIALRHFDRAPDARPASGRRVRNRRASGLRRRRARGAGEWTRAPELVGTRRRGFPGTEVADALATHAGPMPRAKVSDTIKELDGLRHHRRRGMRCSSWASPSS